MNFERDYVLGTDTAPIWGGEGARYTIQVSLLPKPGVANVTGNFRVFKKAAEFGTSDESLFFCPQTGCMGTSEMNFSLTQAEVRLIGENNVHDITAWPQEVVDRWLDWLNQEEACSVCGEMFTRNTGSDGYLFKMPYSRVARRLADLFILLERDVDVVMIVHKYNRAHAKALANMKDHANFDVREFQKNLTDMRDRLYVRYRRDSIALDAGQGKSLTNVFESFLRA
jgi:hypothetical protein